MQSAEVKQIEAFSEAITILQKSQFQTAGVCSWAWNFLNDSIKELQKQQTALCKYHFIDSTPIPDYICQAHVTRSCVECFFAEGQ